MKTRLTFVLLIISMLCVMAFSGCNDNSQNDPVTTKANGETTQAPETTKEPTTVVVWNRIFEEWNQAHFTELAEEYNSLNRGFIFIVDQQFIPGDVWTERMTTAQAANTAPDSYVLSYGEIVAAAKKQTLLPLDDLLPPASFDDMFDNVKEMVSYEGKVYAYPQLVEPSTVLFYRKDLLAAAGYTEPPKTWEQVIEYAKKMKTDEIFGLGFAGFGVDSGWATWGWQYSASGHLALNDNWDAPIIDSGYKDLVEFIKRLYDEKVVPEQPLSVYADIRPFGEGSLAMAFCGSWGIAELKNTYPEILDKVGVALVPTKDGNLDKTTATNGGWTYGIDAQAKNIPGAVDYIYWLLAGDPEVPSRFFELAHYAKAAPRKSVDAIVKEKAGENEWLETVSYVASRAAAEPKYPWDVSMAVALMFENAATGGMTVDEAIADADKTIRDIIENNSLAGTNPEK